MIKMYIFWKSHTYSICFAEMAGDNFVHVFIFAQVQLKQIHFHFTVLHKHSMFNNLQNKSIY